MKHFHGPGHFHELTFSYYRRKPLLTNDVWRERLARSIDRACEREGFQLNAFVFMPEHVHWLVLPGAQQASISRLLARIKHLNPVKQQLCQRAIDWKWSSARSYLNQDIDPALPNLTFPPAELFVPGGVQVAHPG